MPYLAIATNAKVSVETEKMFLKKASEAVAAGTGKPEQYVAVKLDAGQSMMFAATDAPAAFLELKSIGFPAKGVQGLAASLCGLVSKHFDIPGERIYVVFQDVKASMWGHDGATFG